MIYFFLFITTILAESNPDCKSAYCSSCNETDPSICLSCIDLYTLVDGKCVYSREINKCYEYHWGSDTCNRCWIGYKVDFEKHECVEGLETCKYANFEYQLQIVIHVMKDII